MKNYKLKKISTLESITCDVCGASCTTTNAFVEHEYATLEATWGYFSKQDGTQYDIHLCENCFMITISFLRNQRSQNIPVPQNDPFNGRG